MRQLESPPSPPHTHTFLSSTPLCRVFVCGHTLSRESGRSVEVKEVNNSRADPPLFTFHHLLLCCHLRAASPSCCCSGWDCSAHGHVTWFHASKWRNCGTSCSITLWLLLQRVHLTWKTHTGNWLPSDVTEEVINKNNYFLWGNGTLILQSYSNKIKPWP